LHQQDIIEVLNGWDKGKIDLVFMDADKQRYDQYLDRLMPLLADNGIIIVDNAGNYAEHMQLFLEKCKSDKGLVAHFLNIDFGLLLILKNNGTNLYAR
jgi:predicted O-methyltransferase YrrM